MKRSSVKKPRPELEDKLMRKSPGIFDSYQFTHKIELCFDLKKVLDFTNFISITLACNCPFFKIINSFLRKVVYILFQDQP